MADDFVKHVPAEVLQSFDEDGPIYDKLQPYPTKIMERRLNGSLDGTTKAKVKVDDPTSDAKLHTRRGSSTTNPSAGEELQSISSQPDHYQARYSSDNQAPRASSMNPPSLNRHGSQVVNLPPPSSLNQSTINSYLPPIASPRSSDSALREHSAALQHELSIQKIAISSLQGEHDKLLLAFSRSQARVSALERKLAASDSEIITLTEEKLRLQTQAIDLERDISDLSRSRDEFRQAAVKEGSQYVEIVRKASRLEELRGEERRSWNRIKEDLERKIEALRSGASRNDEADGKGDATSAEEITNVTRVTENRCTDTPASSVDLPGDVKTEPGDEPQSVGPTSQPSDTRQGFIEDLKAEISRLRERSTQVENTLRAIRDDNRAMEGIFKAIEERANTTLED